MRRSGFLVLLVGALLLSQMGIAHASSHGAPAVEHSFIGMVLWEIEHFMIHMNLTWQALVTMPMSSQVGWALLGDQALCASMSPLVGVLFSSALSAVATFVVTVLILMLSMVSMALRLRNLVVMNLLRWRRAPHALA